ncbi:hypothetical protein ABZ815_16470 [Nonomuraea sp. NPDC047529]|uniref:hypothetical protein n=1 Tax=Nonomuraea sp. NPDC047529 TaxID=3155623 RepID=UPI0033C6FE94
MTGPGTAGVAVSRRPHREAWARDRLGTTEDGTLTASPDLRERLREEHGAAGRAAAIRAYLRSGRSSRTARCLELHAHLNAWIARTTPDDDFPEALNLLGQAVVLLLENQMGAAAVPIAERVARSTRLHVGEDDHPDVWPAATWRSCWTRGSERLGTESGVNGVLPGQ